MARLNGFYLLSAMCVASLSLPVWALDKETELEIKRLEQRMYRLQDTNDQLVRDMRERERENEQLKKQLQLLQQTVEKASDDLIRISNQDINNLKMQLDQAAAQDWGEHQRACKEFGQHQQIKLMTKNDMAMRTLCFDGKLIHMGTEKLSPPLE